MPNLKWPKRLRRVRKIRGWTQARAAKETGVALRTWISWENDQRKPSGPTTRLLSMVFPELT